ncbi:unnamed protein product [Ceutorhynchus assimilis]|uniref:Uncharacterized protein n=1 Tax=Ceutorhynchus assimilis TaxID=467358 RepID=A0A9N9MXK0_9CUCU|nr:unnamed protein product [Ceutorhynchus assimilis]
MTDNDLEQLATFMGHTTGIHRKSYRLPDDVYQTAKISKLLLLMENGSSVDYKGKSLDEIEVDLEAGLEQEIPDVDPEEDDLFRSQQEIMPSTSSITHTGDKEDKSENELSLLDQKYKKKATANKKQKIKIARTPWTDEQKKVVTNYFELHIKEKKAPKQAECETLISMNHDLLKNKNWLKIKLEMSHNIAGNCKQIWEAQSAIPIHTVLIRRGMVGEALPTPFLMAVWGVEFEAAVVGGTLQITILNAPPPDSN